MCLLLASAAATHATVEEQTPKQMLRPDAGPGPAIPRYTRGAVPGLGSSRSPHGHCSLHFEQQSLPKWIRAFLVPVRKPGRVLSHCGKVSWLRCHSSPPRCPFHKKDIQVLRAGGHSLCRYQATSAEKRTTASRGRQHSTEGLPVPGGVTAMQGDQPDRRGT